KASDETLQREATVQVGVREDRELCIQCAPRVRPALECEPRRHDADDLVRGATVLIEHAPAEDARVAAILSLPELVADDDDLLCSARIVLRREQAADFGSRAQHLKEAAGDDRRMEDDGLML